MRKRLSRRGLLLLAACGALLVSAGVAYATIPDSSGQYHACVHKSSNQVRIIDHDTDNCKQNEQHVHWSQVGPPGAQGPQGDPGAQGAQGPQGPPGPAITRVRVGPTVATTSQANCDPGEVATGGGGAAQAGGITNSFPISFIAGATPTGWIAQTTIGSLVTAYVICAPGP